MEDTKELAKATTASAVDQSNDEAFDNEWYDGKDPTKALKRTVSLATTISCEGDLDLITRASEDHVEGEELMPEAKENWWMNIDDVNWQWLFPTSIDHSEHAAQQEEKCNIVFETQVCAPIIDSDNQEAFCATDELSEAEEPMPKDDSGISWEATEDINWDWIDPRMDLDSDAVPDAQVYDFTQRSHVTFNNWVEVQDTYQELNSTSRGDIRSPSEITPIREADSWSTTSPITEEENLRTVRSISPSQANKCPFLRAIGKVSNNNASQNSLARPDLLTQLKDLAAKLRDLADDINALVGRFAVDPPSDAWIDSVFGTTRSVNGSLELSSNASSASKKHEKDGSRDGSWDNSEC